MAALSRPGGGAGAACAEEGAAGHAAADRGRHRRQNICAAPSRRAAAHSAHPFASSSSAGIAGRSASDGVPARLDRQEHQRPKWATRAARRLGQRHGSRAPRPDFVEAFAALLPRMFAWLYKNARVRSCGAMCVGAPRLTVRCRATPSWQRGCGTSGRSGKGGSRKRCARGASLHTPDTALNAQHAPKVLMTIDRGMAVIDGPAQPAVLPPPAHPAAPAAPQPAVTSPALFALIKVCHATAHLPCDPRPLTLWRPRPARSWRAAVWPVAVSAAALPCGSADAARAGTRAAHAAADDGAAA